MTEGGRRGGPSTYGGAGSLSASDSDSLSENDCESSEPDSEPLMVRDLSGAGEVSGGSGIGPVSSGWNAAGAARAPSWGGMGVARGAGGPGRAP